MNATAGRVTVQIAVLLSTLLVACSEGPPPDPFAVTTTAATTATMTTAATTATTTSATGEESSSGDPDSEPIPYGPCEEDDDCPPVVGKNGLVPEVIECREGLCTYSCGSGFVGEEDSCPDYIDGRSECDEHRCRAIACSETEVNGRCCPVWCGGDCYGPEGESAVCTCDGPGLGCPCETWCTESCGDLAPGLPGLDCRCVNDGQCPPTMMCSYDPGGTSVGHCY